MKPLPILAALLLAAITSVSAADKSHMDGVKRIVFLGDSLTYAGQYVDILEAAFRVEHPDRAVEFINIGLPSETVSGLSEPGHAGGAFPRPTVHERLDRVLAKAKPDLIVACYGMNCGMYYPFSEERFAKYREGMELLRKKSAAIGAKVVHITPPVFDARPIAAKVLPAGLDAYPTPFAGYNDVLAQYSAWLVAQRARGCAFDIRNAFRVTGRPKARQVYDPAAARFAEFQTRARPAWRSRPWAGPQSLGQTTYSPAPSSADRARKTETPCQSHVPKARPK